MASTKNTNELCNMGNSFVNFYNQQSSFHAKAMWSKKPKPQKADAFCPKVLTCSRIAAGLSAKISAPAEESSLWSP